MKKRIFGGMVLLSVLTAAAVAVGLALLWEHGLYRPETAALLILAVLLGNRGILYRKCGCGSASGLAFESAVQYRGI